MAGDIYIKGGKRGVRTSCQIETARRGVKNIMEMIGKESQERVEAMRLLIWARPCQNEGVNMNKSQLKIDFQNQLC
jgi:hypothetical protein